MDALHRLHRAHPVFLQETPAPCCPHLHVLRSPVHPGHLPPRDLFLLRACTFLAGRQSFVAEGKPEMRCASPFYSVAMDESLQCSAPQFPSLYSGRAWGHPPDVPPGSLGGSNIPVSGMWGCALRIEKHPGDMRDAGDHSSNRGQVSCTFNRERAQAPTSSSGPCGPRSAVLRCVNKGMMSRGRSSPERWAWPRAAPSPGASYALSPGRDMRWPFRK